MKTGRFLAIILFAVTGLTTGAWAQAYPPGPSGETSSSEQAPAGEEQAPALAQNYPQGPNGEAAPRSEGPAPSVARVSLIHGDVSTQRGDSGGWGSTSVNAPVVRGDEVATGQDARAEIQLDYANILRLAAHSQAKIADLTPKRIQVQVGQGYASYTMLKGSEADVEIDSPNVAVRPLRAGRYRVQVNSDSETDVIVREGEAEITTPQGSTRVHAGEIINIRGTTDPEYKVSSAPDKDDWDIWNSDRDHVVRNSESVGHTNRYYTGVNDLDDHGRWIYVPGYGNVWQPYQEATWAPYQTGRWVWEPYYGWTWVSYEPWGWAPYHYGRWFYYSNNWCWWPGPVYVHYRPLWSPAFVFFVGFGFHTGFGFGSIGWFPVGPHDPFYPWYGRGFNRVNVVNITNITVINNFHGRGGYIAPLAVRGRQPYFSNAHLALTNPRVRGSITSVSAENFGRGGGHEGWRHGVEEHELRESRVMTANLPVVPSRESLHAGNGNSGAPAGIQTRNNDHFFTKHAPPATRQESFHDQMQRVQRVVGPEAAGANHGNSGGAITGATNSGTGQHSFNEGGRRIESGMNNAHTPNSGSTSGSNAAQDHSRADHSGWNKFGSPSSHSGGEVGNGRSDSSGNPRSSSGGVNGHQINDRQTNDRQTNDRQINDRINDRQMTDHQINSGMSQSSEHNAGRTSHTPESGGWQKFPSSADHGSSSDRVSDHSSVVDHGSGPGISAADRVDHASQGNSGGNSRPPLDLHRPIVTPREQPGNSSPAQRSEPRYNPPAQHNEPRYNPPAPRNESHGSYSGSGSGSHNSGGGSYSRGSGGGSSSHSSGGSSSHGGGGSSSHSGGGHSESHSSSGSSSHHR